MKDFLRELVERGDRVHGRNLAREYLQSRVLREFQLAGAMTSLAFHGGTCLRFVYGLPRYSEDIDFALEGSRSEYDLDAYLRATRAQLLKESYQVELLIDQRRTVHRGLIRFPGILYELGLSALPAEKLSIRIEVDTNPPLGASMEIRASRRYTALRLFCHDRSTLLAGKIHALLRRPYAKGRDWYDLVWHLTGAEPTEPNIDMLNAALRQTKPPTVTLTDQTWRQAVLEKLRELDWETVEKDVVPFLVDQREIDLLNRDDIARILVEK